MLVVSTSSQLSTSTNRAVTHSDEPCATHDCRSQLLFPVLSMSNDDSWRAAVSTSETVDDGQLPVTNVQVWTPAAGKDGDVWPVPVNNDHKRLNTSTNSALAVDNYRYEDNDYYYDGQLTDELELELQDGDTNKYSQTVMSITHYEPNNTFSDNSSEVQRYAHVTSSSSSSSEVDSSESVQQWFDRHSQFGAFVVYTWLAITSASVVIVLMLVRYRREVSLAVQYIKAGYSHSALHQDVVEESNDLLSNAQV